MVGENWGHHGEQDCVVAATGNEHRVNTRQKREGKAVPSAEEPSQLMRNQRCAKYLCHS